jgi:cytochrome b involved in lipid metabolism
MDRARVTMASQMNTDTNMNMNMNMNMRQPSISTDEILKHNRSDDCWIVVENKVWDVTDFAQTHPGGSAGRLHLHSTPVCAPHGGRANRVTLQSS